jgi:hypothetical protein
MERMLGQVKMKDAAVKLHPKLEAPQERRSAARGMG